MKEYVSDFEQWFRKLKQENPDIELKQQEGRNLLWDKRPEQVEKVNGVVTNKQDGYVYYK